jgi:hypothetical protein
VVGCTIGSRGEVPGKRKPVIRDGDDDYDNRLNAWSVSIIIRIKTFSSVFFTDVPGIF